MPKKIKNCFYQKLTFNKLMEAHLRARKHKRYKNEVIKYEMNLENNIINLLNSIKNGTYHLGKYYTFKVFDPKERIIQALPYPDRIVHQWYVEEFIKPYIVPKFINSTFACLEGKGTHKATQKMQEYLKIYQRNYGDFWIMKFDISKFFYSIDPNILFNILKKYISDKKLLRFTHLLIFSSNSTASSIGIPIGNYTSQYFANIYLNELDYFVKRTLKIKFYVRYMDDFIILTQTKNDCIKLKNSIQKFLQEKLHLSLNAKSRYYPSKMGVDFCGYRIFPTHMLLRNSSKKKIKRNVKKWNFKYTSKSLDFSKTMQQLNSWLGHSGHCNSYKLQTQILSKCQFLWTPDKLTEQETYLHSLIDSNQCAKNNS